MPHCPPIGVGLLAVACLIAPVRGAGAAPIPLDVKKAITFIYCTDKDGVWVPVGTGFFVGIEKDQSGTFVYLVTARHVLQTQPPGAKTSAASSTEWPLRPEIKVRINLKGQGSKLSLPIGLALQGSLRNVFTHSDPAVDLAVIPVRLDPSEQDVKYLPADLLTTRQRFDELGIAEGSNVFFTGLFTPYFGAASNYPIVRFGRVALVTPEKIDWGGTLMNLYLIESASYGGNSGSPVFFDLGMDQRRGMLAVGIDQILLAGVMMGSFLEISPLQTSQDATGAAAFSRAHNGIAAVTPAYKVHEILFGDALNKARTSERFAVPRLHR